MTLSPKRKTRDKSENNRIAFSLTYQYSTPELTRYEIKLGDQTSFQFQESTKSYDQDQKTPNRVLFHYMVPKFVDPSCRAKRLVFSQIPND